MTTLRPLGPGHWLSDDGRVEVTLDETFTTTCDADGPHPVRYSRQTVETKFSGWKREQLLRDNRSRDPRFVVVECDGEHYYSQWTVQVDGDWTPDTYDTFAQARAAAEALVGPVKLGRKQTLDSSDPCARVSSAMKNPMTEEVTMSDLHAVFATDGEHNTYRVSDPLSWNAAQNEWTRLDDLRREGRLPQAKFFEVRQVTLGPDRALVGPEVRSHDRYDRAQLNMQMTRPVATEHPKGFAHPYDAARAAWRLRFGDDFTPRGSSMALGRQGLGGWYYYPNGTVAAQGLFGLDKVVRQRKLMVEGANGRWYPVAVEVMDAAAA